MLEISTNSASILRGCPMKYKWHYIDGYIPHKKSSALSLGSVIHAGFDMFYNRFTDAEIITYIKKTIDQELSKISPSEAEDYIIVKYTALGMWLNYPKDLTVFKEIKPEMEFRVEIIPNNYFTGRIDGLVVDMNGRMWVREFKTTSLSFSQFERRAKTSSQGTGYIWAMRKLGYPVVGIMYDFIKKTLLRKGVQDDAHSYGYKIMQDYKLRPDYYFKRHFSYRNEEELVLFEEDLIKVAKDIDQRSKSREWFRNQDQCWNFNSECPYLRICFQKVPDQLTIDLSFDIVKSKNKGGANETADE